MITKINHFSLFVDNIDKALNHYVNDWGFVKNDDIVIDNFRWTTMHLPKQPELEIALIEAHTPELQALIGKQAGNIPMWAINSTDCYATYQELSSKGIIFIETPTERPWGIQAICKDIYGNIICFVQNF